MRCDMIDELVGSVVQVLLFALIPLIFWYVTARKRESFFTWIGLKKPVCGNPLRAILLSAAASLVYIGILNLCMKILPEGITSAGSQFAGQGLAGLPAVFFYAFIRTALSEEILFRGFILKRFQNRFGFMTGNIIQAMLFGLMHGIPFGLATQNAAALFLLTLIPGLFGWYQGWLNEKQCEGSIIPSWLLHGCMNLLTAGLSL